MRKKNQKSRILSIKDNVVSVNFLRVVCDSSILTEDTTQARIIRIKQSVDRINELLTHLKGINNTNV